MGECWTLQAICFYCKEPRHMKRDCPKLGGKEVMSQASVGQRPMTQTSAALQPPIVATRARVQSQTCSSSGPRQGA